MLVNENTAHGFSFYQQTHMYINIDEYKYYPYTKFTNQYSLYKL